MTESMITIGCLMAEVFEQESGEITSTYCHTTESETNKVIVTPQMRQLGDAGYLPIAIARIDSNDPSQFCVCAVRGISEGLRFAIEHQGCDLIHDALSSLAHGQNIPPVSN